MFDVQIGPSWCMLNSMVMLMGLLAGSQVTAVLRKVVFSAQSASISSQEHVSLVGRQSLFIYSFNTGKTSPIAHSTHDFGHPKFLDASHILFVDHNPKTNANELWTLDLKSSHKSKRATLPKGDIERIQTYDGHYVFIYYWVEDKTYSNSAPRKFAVLKDYKPYFSPKQLVADATLDSDGKSVLMVDTDHSGTTQWSGGKLTKIPAPTELRKHVYYAGYRKGESITFAMLPDDKYVVSSGSRSFGVAVVPTSDDDLGPSFFWSSFMDHYYPAFLRFNESRGQFLLFANHEMSDGYHSLTFAVDQEHRKLVSVCKGTYLGMGSNSQIITLNNPWLGPYKRGGERLGRFFLTVRDDLKGAKALTPRNLDIRNADGI